MAEAVWVVSAGQKYSKLILKLIIRKKWDLSKIYLLLPDKERKIKDVNSYNTLKEKYMRWTPDSQIRS